jgi:hypothetical protein
MILHHFTTLSALGVTAAGRSYPEDRRRHVCKRSPLEIQMNIKALVLAACVLIAATAGTKAHDYSNIDCTDNDFLIRMMEDLNAVLERKSDPDRIIDISDASTVSHETTKAVCRVTLTATDYNKAVVTVSIFDNSLGQLLFEIDPIGMLPKAKRKSHD